MTATLQVASVSQLARVMSRIENAQGRHQRPARPRLESGPSTASTALDFGAMPTFRAPRGTRDLLPPETPTWTRLERLAADLAARYGYRRIETPLFEQTDVFERGVGEVTDIVEKELFRLAPRTEEAESWALRPEPTAGIVRAYVQHGMQTWPQPVKLTETGPMFRYDRPQAGPLPAVLAVRRRGDRRRRARPSTPRSSSSAARFYRDAGLDRRRGPAQLDRRRRRAGRPTSPS